MLPPVLPSWFKQRQGKTEPAGDNAYKLTAPNQEAATISIQQAEDGRWAAQLQSSASGSAPITTAAEFPTARDAWDAAFELYRAHVIFRPVA